MVTHRGRPAAVSINGPRTGRPEVPATRRVARTARWAGPRGPHDEQTAKNCGVVGQMAVRPGSGGCRAVPSDAEPFTKGSGNDSTQKDEKTQSDTESDHRLRPPPQRHGDDLDLRFRVLLRNEFV